MIAQRPSPNPSCRTPKHIHVCAHVTTKKLLCSFRIALGLACCWPWGRMQQIAIFKATIITRVITDCWAILLANCCTFFEKCRIKWLKALSDEASGEAHQDALVPVAYLSFQVLRWALYVIYCHPHLVAREWRRDRVAESNMNRIAMKNHNKNQPHSFHTSISKPQTMERTKTFNNPCHTNQVHCHCCCCYPNAT